MQGSAANNRGCPFPCRGRQQGQGQAGNGGAGRGRGLDHQQHGEGRQQQQGLDRQGLGRHQQQRLGWLLAVVSRPLWRGARNRSELGRSTTSVRNPESRPTTPVRFLSSQIRGCCGMSEVGQRGANRLTRDRSTGDGPMTKILTARPTAAQAPAAVCAPQQGRRIGYGRVSTAHQSETQQRAQLEAAGCTRIVTETISSGRTDREGLVRVLRELEAGDTLVIVKLDRLARSLKELLTIAADLDVRGVHLQVLDQAIDTSTPTGRLLFSMLGAVAEFERSLAIERTRASVQHRKETGGNIGGRPKSYTDQQQQLGQRLRAEGRSISEIAAALRLSKGTTHRMLQEVAL